LINYVSVFWPTSEKKMSYYDHLPFNGRSKKKPYPQNSNRFDEESLDAIRRVFPEHSAKILDGPGENVHRADVHRWAKQCRAAATSLLDRASAEKRSLTDLENEGFDSTIRAIDFYVNLHNVDNSVPQAVDGNSLISEPSTPGIYGRNQRCGDGMTAHNGVGLGAVLKSMAIGGGTPEIRNALSEGVDASGGFSVPTQLLNDFIDLLRSKSQLHNAGAKTILLETAKTNLATLVSDPVAGWRAEAAAVSESDLVLGNVQFQPKSLAVLVKVSRELLADSLNVEEILLHSLAQGLATQLDYAGLYGSGASNQPTGLKAVLTTASRTSNLGTNGAKLSASGSYAPLLTAMQKVSLANDAATSAIMNPRTLFDMHGLKDSTGQPLRAPGVIDSLQLLDSNSIPVDLTQGSATTASEIFTGNFSHLVLGLRQELRIELLNQPFADHLQTGFLCHLRADWQVSRPDSFWLTQGILAE
jgi:HK97 family phage major capsid protein